MSHLMRLWYFPSSVNSLLNAHARPSSGARCLIFGLLPHFMCANSEGSGETARDAQACLSHRWDSRLCDKYQNLCWSWSWIIRTTPSKGKGLGSPLAACSVYGDLTRSVHTVNIFSSVSNYQTRVCLCIWGPYVRLAFVQNMLSSRNKVILISVLSILPQTRIWHKNKK